MNIVLNFQKNNEQITIKAYMRDIVRIIKAMEKDGWEWVRISQSEPPT